MTLDFYYSGMIKNEKRKFRGIWWKAGSPGVKRSGILKIRNNRISSLDVDHWEECASSLVRESTSLIYGTTYDNIEFTLFECSHLGTETINTRAGRSRYAPKVICWGGHFNGVDDPLFDKINLFSDGFLGIDEYDNTIKHEDSDKILRIPDNIDILGPINLEKYGELTLKKWWAQSGSPNKGWNIEPTSYAQYSKPDKYSIKDAVNIFHKTRLCFSFLCREKINITIIEMFIDDTPGKQIPCGIICSQGELDKSDNDFWIYPPCVPRDKDLVNKTVQSILNADAETLSALSRYIYAIDNKMMSFDYRIFDLARIFESLSGDKKIISNSESSRLTESILNHYPKDTNVMYLERVKEQLRHANEYSFRVKISEFIKNDRQASQLCPVNDKLVPFISRLVKARNSFAHFDVDFGEISKDDVDRLVRLVDLLFWRKFGCDSISLEKRHGVWSTEVGA